jgi:epoxide hydrolase 4
VESYRVPVIVEDVRALAVKLKARKFVLVGHDWGGVIAWAFAAAHPEMLDKLVIVNAPHPTVFARELAGNPRSRRPARISICSILRRRKSFWARTISRFLQGLMKPWASPADLQEYVANWKRGLTGGLNYYRAARLHSPVDGAQGTADNALPPMKPIETPTLVIWGEKDTALLTGNLNGLDEYVKSLTVRRIADGTHWVIHEKTAE